MSPDLFTHNALVALLILLEPGIKSLGVAQARELQEAALAAADNALVDSHRDRMKVIATKARSKAEQPKKSKKLSEKAKLPDSLKLMCEALGEVAGRSLTTAEYMQLRNVASGKDPTSMLLHMRDVVDDYRSKRIRGAERWDPQFLVVNLIRCVAASYASAANATPAKSAAREWRGDE